MVTKINIYTYTYICILYILLYHASLDFRLRLMFRSSLFILVSPFEEMCKPRCTASVSSHRGASEVVSFYGVNPRMLYVKKQCMSMVHAEILCYGMYVFLWCSPVGVLRSRGNTGHFLFIQYSNCTGWVHAHVYEWLSFVWS